MPADTMKIQNRQQTPERVDQIEYEPVGWVRAFIANQAGDRHSKSSFTVLNVSFADDATRFLPGRFDLGIAGLPFYAIVC